MYISCIGLCYSLKQLAYHHKYPLLSAADSPAEDASDHCRGQHQAAFKQFDSIYTFVRELGNQKLLILNNFRNYTADFELPEEFAKAAEIQIFSNNYDHFVENQLQAYQSIAFLIDLH
ncbi:hypothetical protein [Lactovum odontotermitis]